MEAPVLVRLRWTEVAVGGTIGFCSALDIEARGEETTTMGADPALALGLIVPCGSTGVCTALGVLSIRLEI